MNSRRHAQPHRQQYLQWPHQRRAAGTLTADNGGNISGTPFARDWSSVTVGGPGGLLALTNSPSGQTNRTVLVIGNSGTPGVTTFKSGGTLDLGSNDMIVAQAGTTNTGTLAALTTAANLGLNGGSGAWTGTGLITSSGTKTNNPKSNTALAIVVNDTNQSGTALSGTPLINPASPFNNGLTAFDGQTVNDGDILVKYTYFGDALLTGSVNSADYIQIDAGFASQTTGTPLTGWYNGDFNYDGKINGDDYTLIDNAFNTQGAPFSSAVSAGPAEMIATNTSQIAASAVPELRHIWHARHRRGRIITPTPTTKCVTIVALRCGGPF